MESASPANNYDNKYDWILMLLMASGITLLLFYIKEGDYSMDWTQKWENLVMFFIAMLPFIIGQLFVSEFLMMNKHGWSKTFKSMLSGAIVGILFNLLVVLR